MAAMSTGFLCGDFRLPARSSTECVLARTMSRPSSGPAAIGWTGGGGGAVRYAPNTTTLSSMMTIPISAPPAITPAQIVSWFSTKICRPFDSGSV